MTYYEEKLKDKQMKFRLASAGVVNDILLFADELNTADADTRPEVLRFVLSELLPELEYLKVLQDDVDDAKRRVIEEGESKAMAAGEEKEENKVESEFA